MSPRIFNAYTVCSQRHGQQLMNKHRPTPRLDGDVLNPTLFGEFDKSDSLQNSFGRCAKEGRVCRLSCAPSSAPHALKKRAYGVGGLHLEHSVQITDIDTELQCRCANDAGVAAV